MTQPTTVIDKLRACIGGQVATLGEKLRARRPLPLLPFVGNGLTLLAEGLAPETDEQIDRLQWRKLLESALAPTNYTVESLERRGYDYPLILSFAKELNPGTDIWSQLRRATQELTPTDLHKLLVRVSQRAIATTNFDSLLERSVEEGRNFGVVNCPVTVKVQQSGGDHLRIFKLHGTMPDGDSGQGSVPPKHVIADRSQYERWSRYTNRTFLKYFGGIRSEMEGALCLFIGLRMGADELVLQRLLHQSSGAKCIVTFSKPNEPSFRWNMMGFDVIDIPVGLAASHQKKRLALLVLIECLLKHQVVKCSDGAGLAAQIDSLYESTPKNPLVNLRVDLVAPVVSAAGQVAHTRLFGLNGPPRQEAFHSLLKATLSPTETPDYLLVDQVGGQVGTPSLVWDAIGLPTRLIAQVGDDVPGEAVLNRLEWTKWIDFSDIARVSPKNPAAETAKGFATEMLTTTTWMGYRTGFDSQRPSLTGSLKAEIPTSVTVAYVTPAYWEGLQKALGESGDDPLLVMETGSRGDQLAEQWVAGRNGIILGSVGAFLPKPDSPPHADEPAEKARFHQFQAFLGCLRTSHVPDILKTRLHGARAYITTLGEYGCVLWERCGDEWKDPMWCIPSSFIGEDGAYKGLKLGEQRDGLGCGDCGRAGFVAALTSLLEFRRPDSGIDLTPGIVRTATAWLNWFGLQKVRHFGLEPYLVFLRRKSRESNLGQALRIRHDNDSIELLPDDKLASVRFVSVQSLLDIVEPHIQMRLENLWADVVGWRAERDFVDTRPSSTPPP